MAASKLVDVNDAVLDDDFYNLVIVEISVLSTKYVPPS